MPFLEKHGVHCTLLSLLDEAAYKRGGYASVRAALAGSFRRLFILSSASQYDTIVVHREALPLPTAMLERLLRNRTNRLIFDFDDAIYLPQPNAPPGPIRWLRAASARKFGALLRAAHVTIAGNKLLAERAQCYSKNVLVIPTPVDTQRITPGPPKRRRDKVIIGWMGSPSTAPYLDSIAPALNDVLSKYPNTEIHLVGGNRPAALQSPRVLERAWSLTGEADDLRSFDVGIMPLPDNEWTRGKCGYKALQYMSAGVATVSSPVGVATDMIQPGRTGLLANSREDWNAALSSLVEDSHLRQELGSAGRETAESTYSLKVCAPRFLAALLGKEGGKPCVA